MLYNYPVPVKALQSNRAQCQGQIKCLSPSAITPAELSERLAGIPAFPYSQKDILELCAGG